MRVRDSSLTHFLNYEKRIRQAEDCCPDTKKPAFFCNALVSQGSALWLDSCFRYFIFSSQLKKQAGIFSGMQAR
jgi:hypothetical protein